MKHKKIIYSLMSFLLVLSLIFFGILSYEKSQKLRVIFLNVGQGDAILVMQGSNQVLIDGGPNGQILMEKLGRYVPFWDRKIETIIATHPDQDHIEGLVEAMRNYKVDSIIETSIQSESQIYKKYAELVVQRKIQKVEARAGTKIKLNQVEMEILSPKEKISIDAVKDTNEHSVVTKLVFGQNSFLFTGDLPDNKEMELIDDNANLKAGVLKVAHHGSKYSTSEEFLEKVDPDQAIISVGKNNRYGHPSQEALERIKNRNIGILRTDEVGDIIYECEFPEQECAIIAN